MNLLKKNNKSLWNIVKTANSNESSRELNNYSLRIKKIPVTAVIALSASLLFGSGVFAMPRTIYETSGKQIISSGVTLERVKRYTEEGWLSINVIRADMTNPYVYADVMTDPASIQNTISPLTAAQTEKAVAAVNGSFFMYTGSNNKIIPIGAVVDNGLIKTTYMELNNAASSMATLSVDKFGDILCDFWKTEMWLESASGVTFVTRYNRPYYNYTDLTVLDRTWSTVSAGTAGSDIVEVIVRDETVVEVRSGKDAVTIPENGFVVVSKGAGGIALQSKFKVGDKVSFNIITGPTDWSQVRMAVTGGSLIVKNGLIPAVFSNSSPGRNPRTGMGASRSGKELIMVTVDGRQNSSIGLTQTELAELMIQLGAYNAVNFDGGGSTSMVARLAGNLSPEVINIPSEGVLRKVANAVGIFSRAPAGGVARLVINCEDSNIFAGSSRTFSAKGQDIYYNPISISPSDIVWGSIGVNGRFSGSTFYPSGAGSGRISASYNGVTSYFYINVLESPEILIPGSDSIELFLGETQKLTFEAADAEGRRAKISLSDISFSVVGDVAAPAPGVIANGVFTATSESNGYIKATLGNASAYIGVRVPKHWTLPLDDFQMYNGTFSGYPQSVTGSYGLSYNQAVSGNISGRLAFNFLNDPDKTRAAYLEFSSPIPLEPTALKLSLEVYNTKISTARIRVEITDSRGNAQRLDLSTSLNWTGWKHVEVDLDGFTPAYLKRIYVVQMSNVQETGEVYFDDLTAEIPVYASNVAVPASSVPVDADLLNVAYSESEGMFRFSVFSQLQPARNPLERVLEKRLSERINDNYNNALLLGSGSAEIGKLILKPQLSTLQAADHITATVQYAAIDTPYARFVQLDTSEGGILSSNKNQWQWLLQQLRSSSAPNMFILMNDSLKSFTNPDERDVLRNILSECAQRLAGEVWVFYPGPGNSSYMDLGVKYVSVSSFGAASVNAQQLDSAKFLLVTVAGNEVTYEIKPIID